MNFWALPKGRVIRCNLFIFKEKIKRISTSHERSELAKQSLTRFTEKRKLCCQNQINLINSGVTFHGLIQKKVFIYFKKPFARISLCIATIFSGISPGSSQFISSPLFTAVRINIGFCPINSPNKERSSLKSMK